MPQGVDRNDAILGRGVSSCVRSVKLGRMVGAWFGA